MLFSHTICAVESYRISHDRPLSFGDEIIVEGWFLTHGVVREASIVFPGQKTFVVSDRARQSEAVWTHHRESFGERARACRFQWVEPLGDHTLDLRAAILRFEMEGGETFERPIGSELSLPQEQPFTKAEHDLVMQFESLGDNCEFGLVQRRVGSERLSLLRYAGVGDVEALADAIESGFEAMSEPGAIGLTSRAGEWLATVHSARLAFHTGRSVHSISRETIIQEEARKLIFMAQKFIDDCQIAAKTFVYRVHKGDRGGPLGTRGMDRLYGALSKHGRNGLLWVNVADDEHPDGTIVHVNGLLFRGFIDHLAPAWNAFDFRPQSWLRLLENARVAMTETALVSSEF